MSLIAVTYNDCFEHHPAIPILIGDVLFSTDEVKKNISLPTFLEGADHHLPKNQKYYPYRLRQKLYVINDHIAMALAGSRFEMKRALEDVTTYFRANDSTLQNLKDLYYNNLLPGYTECSYCILLKEQDTNLKILTHGLWKEALTPTFGTVIANALGTDDFIEFVSKSKNAPIIHENIAYVAFERNVTLLGQFMVIEKLTASNLFNAWGTYFELIVLEDNKFKKIDNLTFVVQRAYIDLSTEEVWKAPVFICNGFYHEDLLLIHAIDCSEETNIGSFVVPPLYYDMNTLDWNSLPPALHFKSNEVCLTYLFEFSNGENFNQTYLISGRPPESDKSETIRVTSNDGNTEIFVNPNIESEIFKVAIKKVKSGDTDGWSEVTTNTSL